MKKQLLVGAFMLASFLTAQAQEVLYSQDFEVIADVFPSDPNAPSWGNFDLDGDGEGFGIYAAQAALTNLGFSGKPAGSGNFVTDAEGNITAESPNSDNVLSSVALQFPADQTITLKFKTAGVALEEGAVSPYEVYAIGTDEAAVLGAATNAAEFTAALNTLTAVASGNAPTAAAATITVDLSSYAGEIVEVFFRHRNGGALLNYFFMDDFTIATGTTAGVNENLIASLSVYPNPANDVINVTNAENILVNGITVTDLNGRTVKSVKLGGVANAQINVSDLASGVYMITVSSDKGSLTKKIVKN